MKKLFMFCVSMLLLSACNNNESEDPKLSVLPTLVEAEAAGGEIQVAVTSNEEWVAEVTDDVDWCTVSPASGSGNGTIQVAVEANNLTEERTTNILIKSTTLSKTIPVTQKAAALDDLLVGSWQMDAQNTGDPNYNDLVGMTIELKADKAAIATLGIEIPGVGVVDKIEGAWELEDKTISINGNLMGIPVTLMLVITEMGEDTMNCKMKSSLPGIFWTDGIPVVFSKK